MGTFKTDCRNCQDEILLSNENQDHKWKPYNFDGRYSEEDFKYFGKNHVANLDIHKCQSDEPDTKYCKWCDSEIYFSENADGKWLVYNVEDDSRHFCKRD